MCIVIGSIVYNKQRQKPLKLKTSLLLRCRKFEKNVESGEIVSDNHFIMLIILKETKITVNN